MESQKKRIEKLEEGTEPAPEFDASVLTDEELKFYDETLTKVGYDWDKEGNLSLLTEEEINRLELLTKKATA